MLFDLFKFMFMLLGMNVVTMLLALAYKNCGDADYKITLNTVVFFGIMSLVFSVVSATTLTN